MMNIPHPLMKRKVPAMILQVILARVALRMNQAVTALVALPPKAQILPRIVTSLTKRPRKRFLRPEKVTKRLNSVGPY